jgi:hypothetical protein
MTIAPLQLPPVIESRPIDWSGLDKIGDAIVESQKNKELAAALGGIAQDLTQGTPSATAAAPSAPTTTPSGAPSSTPTYPRIPGYEPSAAASSGPVGPTGPQLPRGLRNNNPGNIEDGALAKSLPGYAGSDGRFAKFDTPDNGLNAMDALLTSYGRRGLKTVSDVIGRWAPASDNNNVGAYASAVSPNGDPNAAIDLSDQGQRRALAVRMAKYENGMHDGGIPGVPTPGSAGAQGLPAPGAPPSPAQMADAAGRMPPEMAKRVQALAAVGSPAATQLATAIISKYIGKQEYSFQTLPDGTVVRTNPMSGTVEPVYTARGTVDVKTPGAFGTTNTTTMQRDANGTLSPIRIAGAPSAPAPAAAPAAGEGVTGEEYLKTLKPEERDVIRKIANYETDPRLLARGGPGHAAAVMSAVAQYDPTYDQALYPARAAAYKEFFAGGNASPAGQITAGNTAIQHLGRLSELSDKIGGTNDAWVLNEPINKLNEYLLKKQDNPDLRAYKTAMDRFTEEATKFYRASGGSEADINRAISNMTAGQSPAARTAAIREEAGLMQSKINALSDRLKNALGPKLWEKAAKENPELVITQNKSADALSRIRGETPATTATPAQPAIAQPAAAPAASTMPQQPPSVPPGSQYSPSRKMWRAPNGNLFDATGKPMGA